MGTGHIDVETGHKIQLHSYVLLQCFPWIIIAFKFLLIEIFLFSFPKLSTW